MSNKAILAVMVGAVILVIFALDYFISDKPQNLVNNHVEQTVPGGNQPAKPKDSSPSNDPMSCIQVITPARNLQTGEVKDFPTPCDVPSGWEKVDTTVR